MIEAKAGAMLQTLCEAGAQFQSYADSHKAKGADEKAARNQDWANNCLKAATEYNAAQEAVDDLYGLDGDTENDWRLGTIIHLRSSIASYSLSEDFVDMLDWLDEKCVEVFDQFPFLREPSEKGTLDEETALELFCRYQHKARGYFVRAEWQIPTYVSEDIFQHGWGYSGFRWIWVPEIAAAEHYAARKAREQHEEAKREWREKKKAANG